MLKEVARLQETTTIKNIVYKQKVNNFQKTHQEFHEKKKVNQDKLDT